ncbi:hypothetical protein [Belnapia sp. F-4-1]|uniref:hypothetical protein n=1 Tax=Belnapia sp. F-4-1 TaxID=1545443 RepID=UPI0005BD1089|nr:hypothetical protein [Belnapia sp. F-4-1]
MTQATLAAIEALYDTVVMARALATSGRQIDLAGLDTEAAALCAAIAQMPRHRAKLLRPALESLAQEVEGLAAALPPP